MSAPAPLHVREHGSAGPPLVVVHGGPGAPGAAGGLAAALAEGFRVLEPWQRASGDVPLTVAGHVDDLLEVLDRCLPGERPALVGESWGAMLSLVFAARHPERVAALLLVGCGTFDPTARAQLLRTLAERTTPALRRQLDAVADDPEAAHRLSDPLYTYRRDTSLPPEPETGGFDTKGHHESWNDMLRLQAGGELPAAFAAIRCPVRMLHGSHDPHPGPMIRDGLAPHLPQLEYQELPRCGHSPWVEAEARAAFVAAARGWLGERMAAAEREEGR